MKNRYLLKCLIIWLVFFVKPAIGADVSIEEVVIYWMDPWTSTSVKQTAEDVIGYVEKGEMTGCKIEIHGNILTERVKDQIPKSIKRLPEPRENELDVRMVFRFYTNVKANAYVQLNFQDSDLAKWDGIEAPSPSSIELNHFLYLLPKALYDHTIDPFPFFDKKK